MSNMYVPTFSDKLNCFRELESIAGSCDLELRKLMWTMLSNDISRIKTKMSLYDDTIFGMIPMKNLCMDVSGYLNDLENKVYTKRQRCVGKIKYDTLKHDLSIFVNEEIKDILKITYTGYDASMITVDFTLKMDTKRKKTKFYIRFPNLKSESYYPNLNDFLCVFDTENCGLQAFHDKLSVLRGAIQNLTTRVGVVTKEEGCTTYIKTLCTFPETEMDRSTIGSKLIEYVKELEEML